jgi:hypothetical protein
MSRGKRKPLNSEERFVFGSDELEQEAPKPTVEQPQAEPKQPPKSPWGDIEAPEKEATIRLNVDIPISLNDRLGAKARQMRKPKTELVRRLLEWALDESNE